MTRNFNNWICAFSRQDEGKRDKEQWHQTKAYDERTSIVQRRYGRYPSKVCESNTQTYITCNSVRSTPRWQWIPCYYRSTVPVSSSWLLLFLQAAASTGKCRE